MAKQQVISGADSMCPHRKLRPVESMAGETIAMFCACGAKLWELGDCDGCGAVRTRVTKFVAKRSGWKRFCDGVCQTDWEEAEKEKRKASFASRAVAK